MSKILVLGADGMVGHLCRTYLSERGHEVVSVARTVSKQWAALDLENEADLRKFIDKARPEYIINGVGVLIKQSELDPIRALRLNALLPQLLSVLAKEYGFHLIQLSSDCVFSGFHGPYSEGSMRDADEIYGRTKALGEVQNGDDLTIRTSKIGPEIKPDGTGLFHWFMSQTGTVTGFGMALWGGVTTLELAKFIDHLTRVPLKGLLHLTNGDSISKHDLLALIKAVWSRDDIELIRNDTRASDRSLISARGDNGYRVPNYEQMLVELRDFMVAHNDLYSNYLR